MSLHRVTLGPQWDRKPGHIFSYPFSTVTCLHVVMGLRPWGPLYRTKRFNEAGVFHRDLAQLVDPTRGKELDGAALGGRRAWHSGGCAPPTPERQAGGSPTPAFSC